MSKLIYGKKGQVEFKNEAEKQEAFDYLLSGTKNVVFVHENNQNQGAWGPEKRIHFITEENIPVGLLNNMTAGRNGVYGRINCGELVNELIKLGLVV